jgi:succinoglycan biosynthesis protein ExoV
MKMYYCKTPKPNFGDELNSWLWPQLIDAKFDSDNSKLFLGIGSILYDSFPKEVLKVVVGAGYGGYTPPPKIDDSWRIYFVRGKLTAKHLLIDAELGIGDAAILIRSCIGPEPKKVHKVSFMPHWESTLVGDWSSVCQEAGIHYLDPCAKVTEVIQGIRESELVVTEAMHGAIVSDALRVPWIPVRPIDQSHRMKWDDWASALDMSLMPSVLTASTFPEYLSGRLNSHTATRILQRQVGKLIRRVSRASFLDSAASRLTSIATGTPCMSSDSAITSAHEKMLTKLEAFSRDF